MHVMGASTTSPALPPSCAETTARARRALSRPRCTRVSRQAGRAWLRLLGCAGTQIFATGNEYLERCNGTPAFLAPEMMKPNMRFRGRPTDVYALGACLYTLVFGRIPFSAPNLYKLFQASGGAANRAPSHPRASAHVPRGPSPRSPALAIRSGRRGALAGVMRFS